MPPPDSIQTHFGGQCVFITGATGFLGLALVFKIISSTPCQRLFLLVRGGGERFWPFVQSKLPAKQYELLVSAAVSQRIKIYNGNIEKPNLGLAPRDFAKIRSTVTIYIHSASSIDLQQPLPSIAASVLEPSLQIAEMALNSPNLERFIYVSTVCVNFHLHQLHSGIETFISESVYLLDARGHGKDSFALEYADLCSLGTTLEYQHYKFPFAYAYAKHLTERLLIDRFSHPTAHGDRSSSLLIVRPSAIGPALQEPFPAYEISGSAPKLTFLAALKFTPSGSRDIVTACRFPNPDDQATLDEIPVDLVVNRILVHTARGTAGVVHAVAGPRGVITIREIFESAKAHGQIPRSLQLVWRDVDWADRSLHPIMQMYKVGGTAFVLSQTRTQEAWALMSAQERQDFPLMVAGAAAVEEDGNGNGNGRDPPMP